MKKLLVILAIAIVVLGGGAFVYSQTAGREATIDCPEPEPGAEFLECNIRIALEASNTTPLPEFCMNKDEMVRSDDHNGMVVWYADSDTGPNPVGYSVGYTACILPY